MTSTDIPFINTVQLRLALELLMELYENQGLKLPDYVKTQFKQRMAVILNAPPPEAPKRVLADNANGAELTAVQIDGSLNSAGT